MDAKVYHFRDSIRVYITVTDKLTGEPVEIPVRLTTSMVVLHLYGRTVQFTTSNRAKGTYLDSRDQKRHPRKRALAELKRMAGATFGTNAYNEWIKV